MSVKGTPIPIIINGMLSKAPPSFYIPNEDGVAVPLNCTQCIVTIDQSTIPDGITYSMHIEFKRDGLWGHEFGSDFLIGGKFFDKNSFITINTISFDMFSRDEKGSNLGTYPTDARIRMSKSDNWLIPIMAIKFI